MLERLRHRRHLGTAVLAAFVLAWLAALFAGVPTRMALAQLQPADVCATAPHTGHDAPAAEHAHHLDPGCLLCVALATPPALRLAAARPPAPPAHLARPSPAAPLPAWRAQAPLPARGPPSLHA
ncbi:hypothetical protein [Acidovorax sp. MR-S7]|uniref:hypothetical protein n=1 Tax=Acidovorax sp. MR-S7 TaxID=1268622 RepID=UPI0003764C3F|nr:hypothetical protein [Acidovorax sp. MR-S7]GAD22302.1 hypothetical protein AVS7_02062 [Acidovorax sp. MR-S7]